MGFFFKKDIVSQIENMKILRIYLAYMLFQLATSKYSYVTTLTASTPSIQDGFGTDISLVVNGTTLILAANVPNVFSNPHVEIFKSEDNGQTWSYSQSMPSFVGDFATAFSDNGTSLIIGGYSRNNPFLATLFNSSNGQYLNSSLDLTCNISNAYYFNRLVALSGDGKWAFVVAYSYGQFEVFIYTNTQTGECQVVDYDYYDNDRNNYDITTNFDGSTLVICYSLDQQSVIVLIYTAFSYKSIPPYKLNFNYAAASVSLTHDGSILALGLCGCCVHIYQISDLTVPIQIILPPPISDSLSWGCGVYISNDGMRLIVGSNVGSSGSSYAYNNVGGFFQYDMILIPFINGGSDGSLAVVNTLANISIVLIGGPTSGFQQSGQIAVFQSVPDASVTATPTASSSASATSTSTPSSQPINALAANSSVIGVTSGISIFGGIIGSVIGYFLIRWLRRRSKTNKTTLDSINSTSNKGSLLELYST